MKINTLIFGTLLITTTCLCCCYGAPLISKCEELFYEQPFDHFTFDVDDNNFGANTFKQRYFVCSEDTWKPDGPVFFYTGNEADVTLYLNATGLMWENAADFGALLIFAEHRYFGKSVLPTPSTEDGDPLRYLTPSQAIEDYAELISYLRTSFPGIKRTTPFVAFGGSYGGMLSAWLRMKHPESVVGSIAASAPILSFLGLDPEYDIGGSAKIVTEDVTPTCRNLIHSAFEQMVQLGRSNSGRVTLTQKLGLCEVPESFEKVRDLVRNWAQDAISFLAMGNFPFHSSYITNGLCMMPKWPLDLGCATAEQKHINDPLLALRDVYSVFLNCSQSLSCFNTSSSVNEETVRDGYLWSHIACTESLIPSSMDGVNDMFYSQPWDLNAYIESCQESFPSVVPRPYAALHRFGGNQALRWATNIVFSNGSLDPWRAGGVQTLPEGASDTLKIIIIERGAHHVDLMFSNEDDLPSFVQARKTELDSIRSWIKTANNNIM